MRDTTLTSPEMHMERVAAYEISCLLGKYNWPKIFYLFYFIIIYFILFYFIFLLLLFYFIIIIIIIIILLIIYFLESQACLRFELHAKTSSGNDSWVLFFFHL